MTGADFSNTRLNQILDDVDSRLGLLEQGLTADPIAILERMDAIAARLQAEQDQDRKAELAQFEYLAARLTRNAARLLKRLGGHTTLVELRAGRKPPTENAWWFLDDFLQQQFRRSLRRALITIAAVALFLIVATLIYNRFFAPSPESIARFNALNSAEDFSRNGDFSTALSKVEDGLKVNPQDSELLLLKGALLLKLGRNSEADQVFAQAEALINDAQVYGLERTSAFLRSGQPEQGLKEAQALTKNYPDSAEGHYYAGIALQSLDRVSEAAKELERASGLASKQGKTALEAQIRVILANMSQMIPMPSRMP